LVPTTQWSLANPVFDGLKYVVKSPRGENEGIFPTLKSPKGANPLKDKEESARLSSKRAQDEFKRRVRDGLAAMQAAKDAESGRSSNRRSQRGKLIGEILSPILSPRN